MIELTKKEREVAELLVQGYSNTQIANKLCVTRYTIYTHVNHIYEKYLIFTNSTEEKNTLRLRLALAYLRDTRGLDIKTIDF